MRNYRCATAQEHSGCKKGQAKARMVVLEDSYHMVCVDNDKEIVTRKVLEFIGASTAGSLMQKKGAARETAMSEYMALVSQLKATNAA